MGTVNPLFPKGTDSGIYGAWQQAAFMDDTDEMERDFKRKKASQSTRRADAGIIGLERRSALAEDIDKTYRDYKKIAPSGKLTRGDVARLLKAEKNFKSDMIATSAFCVRNRRITRAFKEWLQQSRQLKKSGEITKKEYRRRKKFLVKAANRARRENQKQYNGF